MKKVFVKSAALALVGALATVASAIAAEPGVQITGDSRARLFYKSAEYFDTFGTFQNPSYDAQTNFDSRVRLNFTGTSAGGSYVKARLRIMETYMSDIDTDVGGVNDLKQNNLWSDIAYFGVPFTDQFTLEVGKYRVTYGPLPTTYNFFYDDVNLAGARGIIKINDIEINPFVEYMDEAQNQYAGTVDQRNDNDEIRFGGHLKAKINKDWIAGTILGYQVDNRNENDGTLINANAKTNEDNEGFFGSIYASGKAGAFGFNGELAVTDSNLNGFNSWREDQNYTATTVNTVDGDRVTSVTRYIGDATDSIGSNDTGFGGYVFPTFTMEKLTIGLNTGFTVNGFLPDRAYGFVMLGSTDNSVISAYNIGATGDWYWAGLVASYAINDSLKLTGNFVYADVSPWDSAGDGPGFKGAPNSIALDNAFELSAVLQYTISKGADVFVAAGYLDPNTEYVHQTAAAVPLNDDGAFGAYTRFELKF